MSTDKRRASRMRKRLAVRYGEQKPERVGYTRNISATGLFIQTNSVVPPGTIVRLEIEFPDRTFALKGLVAWAKKVPPRLAHLLDCGMGIRFVQPSEEFCSFFEDWSE